MKAPELIFSGVTEYPSEAVASGESTILINGVGELTSGVDSRAWARNYIGRHLPGVTLYVRHLTHVEEHRMVDGKAVELVHPVWHHSESSLDLLLPLLRGEWEGHVGQDIYGSDFDVTPTPGQEGYKLFLGSMPLGRSVPNRMLSKFLADARVRGLVVPDIYYDSVKALAAGLNFGGRGLVYNPYYPARHGELITCQGRRLHVKKPAELAEAKLAIETVGFTVEELLAKDVSVLTRFNIASARWAATHWHKDVMPLGPKGRAAEAEKMTA